MKIVLRKDAKNAKKAVTSLRSRSFFSSLREINFKPLVTVTGLILFALVFLPTVNAQDSQPFATPQPTPLTAPPPFKMIVKEERSAIELQRDSQKHLKL